MTNDVTIMYQGGSGGFALFYYLLLSGKYTTGIRELETTTVDQLITMQFNSALATQQQTWKHQEFWPNNLYCKENLSGPRLFLLCNPLFNPSVLESNKHVSNHTHKILLFTDLKLQLRMAFDKQAYWFTKESRRVFQAPNKTFDYLNQIYQTGVNGFDPMIEQVKQQFNPDQTVRLEHFVKSKTIPGFDCPTQQQIEFLNYWKTLNSKKAIRLLDREC